MSERRLSEQSTRPFSDKGDILGSFFVTKNLPKKEPVSLSETLVFSGLVCYSRGKEFEWRRLPAWV
jgi:hypothetical protein